MLLAIRYANDQTLGSRESLGRLLAGGSSNSTTGRGGVHIILLAVGITVRSSAFFMASHHSTWTLVVAWVEIVARTVAAFHSFKETVIDAFLRGNPSAHSWPRSELLTKNLLSCFRWFFFADTLADFEFHLAGFLVGVDDDVVAVQHFAVENLHGQRILHQLLDRALQRARAEIRIVAFGEEQLFRGVGELERNLAVGQQAAHVFEPQLDDLDQLLFAQRAEDDDVVDAVQELGPEVRVQRDSSPACEAFVEASSERCSVWSALQKMTSRCSRS